MNKPFEKPRTIALAVQSEIRDLIARGDLKPGDRINEVTLSKMLDVSRGVVREALRSLQNEHLISYEAQKGARVRELSSEEARELYDIRLGLAMIAAPLIATNCSKDAAALLGVLVTKMDEFVAYDDLPNFHMTNRQFHELLFSQSQNRRLLQLYMSLFDEVVLLRSLNFLSQGSTHRSQQGHKRIVSALSTGDEAKITTEITNHLSTSREFVVTLIEETEAAEENAIQ